MAIRVLEETGLLPHLNPGVMSWEEMNRLKPVAPSMGMMLETTSRRLFETRGEAHHGSPDKDPAVRLRVLEDAGRLVDPVHHRPAGRHRRDAGRARRDDLRAARHVSRAYGAVQEVIVQNFRAKPDTAMRHTDDLGLEEYRAAIAVTRLVLGPKARVQAPPNLVDLAECRALLEAGVDDWGGVSPLTPDHVNPERPWPSLDRLRDDHRRVRLRAAGPAHRAPRVRPRRASPGSTPGSPPTSPRSPTTTASPAPAYARPACPGRSPTAASPTSAGTGRIDLHTAVDTEGRSADRRSDFDDVYGDWDVGGRRHHAGVLRPHRTGSTTGTPPCAPPSATPATSPTSTP